MKKNKAFENYSMIAKDLNSKNLRILSGRYKFFKNKYKYIIQDIYEKLSINKKDDIFDIGTGDGEIIANLSKKSKSATTIDSIEIINKIPKKKNVKYLKGNIHQKGKKIKKKFDKILVYSVIQYFADIKEVITFINLCLSLLKKTGIILIGDIPNADMDKRYQNTIDYQTQRKIFEKKKSLNQSKIDKKFFNLTIGKTIKFTDKNLNYLLKRFNTINYESYILPQRKELPHSVKRVDLLIKKRS